MGEKIKMESDQHDIKRIFENIFKKREIHDGERSQRQMEENGTKAKYRRRETKHKKLP